MAGEATPQSECPVGEAIGTSGEDDAEVIRMVLSDAQAHSHQSAAWGIETLTGIWTAPSHVRRHRNSKCSCTEESK